ncbi:hypothetical protein LCGC14_2969660 [marine sediment metagenome]|uniref:Uncharacterized protein n=1 Tax=marine sediment metagenome TaxID=412755 RepID=A0A0F8XXB6_9ZZZZ
MTDEYMVYRVLGVKEGERQVELDFEIGPESSELEGFRCSGREIHYRMYRVRKYGQGTYWLGPWKLDTPSEEQNKVIKVAGPYGVELKVTAAQKNYKRGWVFVKLKERFDPIIAGHVYKILYASWSHTCPKRKHDNVSMSIDVDEKCPDCGADKDDVL